MNLQLKILLFLLASLLWTHGLFAQAESLTDHILMKDSSEYRGRIVEFNLHENVIIRLINGQKLTIPMTDVDRIDRQDSDLFRKTRREKVPRDRKRILYEPKQRAYFGQLQKNLEFAQFGLQTVHGYRLSNWHQLGIGFGFNFTATSLTFIPSTHNSRQNQIEGIYTPLFLHYGGNLPSGGVVPFYALELGYAFRLLPNIEKMNNPLGLGGVHAATVFGVRLRTRSRYNFRLGLRLSFRSADFIFREYSIDPDKGIVLLDVRKRTVASMFIGLSFIHSFGR
ncbi:MAG: hypothetical protein K9J17_16505 [Flavobacteriales bacterium]|nr:hypothetical protein [Flavobacteriales bacterium]